MKSTASSVFFSQLLPGFASNLSWAAVPNARGSEVEVCKGVLDLEGPPRASWPRSLGKWKPTVFFGRNWTSTRKKCIFWGGRIFQTLEFWRFFRSLGISGTSTMKDLWYQVDPYSWWKAKSSHSKCHCDRLLDFHIFLVCSRCWMAESSTCLVDCSWLKGGVSVLAGEIPTCNLLFFVRDGWFLLALVGVVGQFRYQWFLPSNDSNHDEITKTHTSSTAQGGGGSFRIGSL